MPPTNSVAAVFWIQQPEWHRLHPKISEVEIFHIASVGDHVIKHFVKLTAIVILQRTHNIQEVHIQRCGG